MATTSPDNIYSPDAGQPYALTPDLLAMADSVQDALNNRAIIAVRVYRAALHSSGSPFQTNGGTFRLNWDSELEDPWGFHSTSNPDRLTVPPGMGGVYSYFAKTRVEDNSTTECLFFLDKNGIKVEDTEIALQGGFYKRGLITGEITLAAGDWVAYCVNKPGDLANLTPAQSVFGLRWERP